MDKHISLARELGYEGQELRDNLKRQHDLEREERVAQREYEREKREALVLKNGITEFFLIFFLNLKRTTQDPKSRLFFAELSLICVPSYVGGRMLVNHSI